MKIHHSYATGRVSWVASVSVGGLVALACLFGPTITWGQSMPVEVNCLTPVLNHWGVPLTPDDQALVHLLVATDGIFPPDYSGLPHEKNPVIHSTRIGNGIARIPATEGRFNTALNRRPVNDIAIGNGLKIFARVYNAPEVESATFYTDSQIFTISGAQVFYPELTATTEPTDPRDSDGDGLNNSWELSLGTDPYLRDTDGDGVSDYDEMMAGTDPLDPTSYLAVDRMASDNAGNLWVEWGSAIGHTYQLQRSTNSLNDPGLVFDPVNQPIVADDVITSTTVTNETPVGHQFFRIEVITPEAP